MDDKTEFSSQNNQVVPIPMPLASNRPLIARINEEPIMPTGRETRHVPVVDYGFTEDINRRIEVNFDPKKARHPIPLYLKKISDTLFSKATAREIFMVKIDSLSNKPSRKWRSKGRLSSKPPELKGKTFKKAYHRNKQNVVSKLDLPIKKEDESIDDSNPNPDVGLNINSPKKLLQSPNEKGRRLMAKKSKIEKDNPTSNLKVEKVQGSIDKNHSDSGVNSENREWILTEMNAVAKQTEKISHDPPMSENFSIESETSQQKMRSEGYSENGASFTLMRNNIEDRTLLVKKVDKNGKITDEEEEGISRFKIGKCVVCCQKEPDSVVLPCGHSGVCNFCAINIFDNSGKCPICRSVIIFDLGHNSNTPNRKRQSTQGCCQSGNSLGD